MHFSWSWPSPDHLSLPSRQHHYPTELRNPYNHTRPSFEMRLDTSSFNYIQSSCAPCLNYRPWVGYLPAIYIYICRWTIIVNKVSVSSCRPSVPRSGWNTSFVRTTWWRPWRSRRCTVTSCWHDMVLFSKWSESQFCLSSSVCSDQCRSSVLLLWKAVCDVAVGCQKLYM